MSQAMQANQRSSPATARRVALVVCAAIAVLPLAGQQAQKRIDRVSRMSELPSPFEMRDWKRVARGFDALIFDAGAKGQYLPLFKRDSARLNFAVDTFFVPSYVGDNRQQPGAEEAITTMGALLGASLVGIDRGTPEDSTWVLGQLAYYNPVAGLLLNNVSRGPYPGYTFWYELFPAMLFSCLVWRHPAVADRKVAMTGGSSMSMREVMRAVASRYRDAAERLGAGRTPGFNCTSFNFQTMQPVSNGKWTEPDGAAGIAWLLYMAWVESGDRRLLEAADWCLRWLDSIDFNPFYETLLPFGAYLAARMNAEQGCAYRVSRLIDWCFGPSEVRPGWGVIADRWGGYDVHGLLGSLTDGGGYAFAMNTFDAAAALVPLVRYDTRFARDIGKWMLNLANSARLFYGPYHPLARQSSGFWKGDPQGVVAYEGLRKEWEGKSPYATGDPIRMGWGKTDLGLYGSSHVGLLAAIVSPTSDGKILQLDLLATDFFHAAAYPTFLYYNPYAERKAVRVDVGTGPLDLYSPTEKRFIARGVRGSREVPIEPRSAQVLVLAPAGGKATLEQGRLLVDGVVVDWQPAAVVVDSPAPGSTAHDAQPIVLEAAFAPGVGPAAVSLFLDGAVLKAGMAPTERFVLETEALADGRHELAATLAAGGGVVARDAVSFVVDNRLLAKAGALDFQAWKPWHNAPGRLEISGSAAYVIEENPRGERGGVVSPPVRLAFGRSPVLVFDGIYPRDRWSLLVRFPGNPALPALEVVEPTESAGRVEVDLRQAVDAAARKARVASPIGTSDPVEVELVLATVGEGSRVSFFHEGIDLLYRGGR